MLPLITTRRLRLRPLTESDLPAYQALITDSRVSVPAGLTQPLTDQQALASLVADRQQPVSYAVVWPTTNRLIGTVMGYEHSDTTGAPDATALDLGYLLAPAYWGQGLMPEALAGWLATLPTTFPALTTVWAASLATNQRSQQVLIKSAFELIDDQMMAPIGGSWELQRQFLYRLTLKHEKIMSK